MSRNILKKRPPASPNQPPPAPAKMALKGQPVPINVNLLIQGNHIDRVQSANVAEQRRYSVEKPEVKRPRPHSAQVDKYVLKSMLRSPSVDSSFYDRFERLDRDSIIGDTAYKEKGGRVRSGRKRRKLPRRPSSSRSRKRSQSASCVERSRPNESKSRESFFEMAMSFDDETKQNTISNAVRQISPRALGIEAKTGLESKRRPRSGKKSRERSRSGKHSDRSGSVGRISVGSGISCSSKGSEKSNTKEPHRKSRSRTRKVTPKSSDQGNSSQKSSPVRRNARSASYSGRNRSLVADTENIRQKVTESRCLRILPTPPAEPKQHNGDFAYHYTDTGNRADRKSSVRKSQEVGNVAIDAVKKANESHETSREIKEIDQLFFGRPVCSKLPKLKMFVASTALPLASLVRSASAKMLMTHQYDSKPHYV